MSVRGTTAQKKKRRRLFKVRLWQEQFGKCWWCGCDIVLYDMGPKEKQMPRDLATFDHLDSRFNPERGRHHDTVRTVLACWECNNHRADEEQKSLPIEQLWERSGAFPYDPAIPNAPGRAQGAAQKEKASEAWLLQEAPRNALCGPQNKGRIGHFASEIKPAVGSENPSKNRSESWPIERAAWMGSN